MDKWSKEKAWKWYNNRDWICGYNGLPSLCVNKIALWQKYNHKAIFKELDEEFALANKTGFNAIRISLELFVYYKEHDSYMNHIEEYISLAFKHGIRVMFIFGNDCNVPKSRFKMPKLGKQRVDWGYHSGVKNSPHTGDFKEMGYQLTDDEEFEKLFYKMVKEIVDKYKDDDRILMWNVWNEVGGSFRGCKSIKYIKNTCKIIREVDSFHPITIDTWKAIDEKIPATEEEKIACELSDIISFHHYGSFRLMKKYCEDLKREYGRPVINTEWLNRIFKNNVVDIIPYFYENKIGSFLWGLKQGYSQTYEPWGGIYIDYMNGRRDLDIKLWQHDLYHFNNCPYDFDEIECIQKYSALSKKH